MVEDGGGAAPAAKRQKSDAAAKFRRGPEVATRHIEDRKLKGKLRYTERVVSEAQQAAAKVDEWLLPAEPGELEAEGMERTWRFSQADIVQAVEVGAARKAFDLSLPQLGPYSLAFTRSGRHMLLAGRKGHLALMDWQRSRLVCEVQVRETTHDACFLHNEQFFAAAQKKYVYIYDKRGLEVHCLKDTTDATRLEFLPHHFLLCSVGASGVVRWQDTSTGRVVAALRTKQGPCDVMRQNPWNAVLCLGHGNGTVTMWSPNITTPAVRMLCHHGPVRSLAVDPDGRHMVTTGADGQVKVWDIRTLRPLHAYYSPSPADWCDISQRGMLAVGYGRRVQVWKDALASKQQSPYMTHTLAAGTLRDFHFCPYEDVLAIGHSGGVSTMLVPGAGEPNYDSFVADPFQTRKQRMEAEVHTLLDKLQPEMIVLDPGAITRVVREPKEVQKQRQTEAEAANRARMEQQRHKNEEKKPMKGKNKPTRRQRKKQANIIEEKKPEIKARMREQGVAAEYGHKRQAEEADVPADVPRALHRFFKK
ncbi:WD40 repeat [Micractinium conductrix]|uniref:WD40 repeat n=1 Tax=Micractinium conductrix TaxID=554055 RepID=A0A2P6VBK8_9CHLO|nr:WD40 repeat [Micractinium conductrix]|eukprot:PSC71469.1 WD40 repeat [Micractinium conductrix]